MWRHQGKPGLWSKKGVFLDQPLLYIYIHRLFLNNCAESEKSVFCRCSCDKKSKLRSDASQNLWHIIKACSFCSSISQVFPDDITYLFVQFFLELYPQTLYLYVCFFLSVLWRSQTAWMFRTRVKFILNICVASVKCWATTAGEWSN